MTTDTFTLVTLIITALAALGALGSAIGSFLSARSTKTATEASFLSSLMNEYMSRDMRDALRTLRNWESRHGNEFATNWFCAFKAGDAEASKVDDARRLVKSHFFKALQLHEAGYTTRNFLRHAGNVAGVNIFYDIVEPLDNALGATKEDERRFRKLREICPPYPGARLREPVPVSSKEEG